jgi:hypothetical protein
MSVTPDLAQAFRDALVAVNLGGGTITMAGQSVPIAGAQGLAA